MKTSGVGHWVVLVCMIIGCDRSPGPVHKLNLHSEDISEIQVFLGEGAPQVTITNKGIIERCVNEINRLAYIPYHPPLGLDDLRNFTLLDNRGNKLLEFDAAGFWLVFYEPGKEPFWVLMDPKLTTCGKLHNYARYTSWRESLLWKSRKAKWDETEKRMVLLNWRYLTEFHGEPYVSWPVPATPDELGRRLNDFPKVTEEDVDKFSDHF